MQRSVSIGTLAPRATLRKRCPVGTGQMNGLLWSTPRSPPMTGHPPFDSGMRPAPMSLVMTPMWRSGVPPGNAINSRSSRSTFCPSSICPVGEGELSSMNSRSSRSGGVICRVTKRGPPSGGGRLGPSPSAGLQASPRAARTRTTRAMAPINVPGPGEISGLGGLFDVDEAGALDHVLVRLAVGLDHRLVPDLVHGRLVPGLPCLPAGDGPLQLRVGDH